MTERNGIFAAVGAIGSSLATLACCLPVGLLGAAGLAATAAGAFNAGRPWLLGLSFVFLSVGFAQAWQAKRCGVKPNPWVIGMLGVALGIVLLVALFPQLIAGWLADLGSGE